MSRTADSPAARPAAAPLRDGVVLALLAFAVGRLLAQDTFYGPDGRMLIKMTMSGLVAHPLHWFAPQFLRASHAAIAWTGGSWYEAGLLLSQVGFAFAAFAWHRAAAVLGVPRGRAAVVVALCATAPAILFFTSVVELHAPFLAFAAGACWAAARLATRPTPGAGVLFGVVTGVALGAHATAHLLVPWLLIFAWLRAPRGAARFLPWLGAVAAHVAVSVALPVALRAAGAAIEAGGAGSYLLFEARGRRLLAALPAQTWTDWLRPFAPLSFVALVAARRAARHAAAFLLGLGASIAVTALLMAPTTENGAYLVPLVWPAALLVVQHLRPWAWWLTIAAGAALGWSWIAGHDRPEFGHAFAADVRAFARGAPVRMILGEHREFDACLIAAPELDWIELIDECHLPPESVPGLVEGLRRWIEMTERDGGMVLITEGALRYLEAPIGPEMRTGPRLRAAILSEFEREPVHGTVLRAWRLRVR